MTYYKLLIREKEAETNKLVKKWDFIHLKSIEQVLYIIKTLEEGLIKRNFKYDYYVTEEQ